MLTSALMVVVLTRVSMLVELMSVLRFIFEICSDAGCLAVCNDAVRRDVCIGAGCSD